MPDPKFYVFTDNGSKSEGMNKEQIINAIVEATSVTPVDPDAGFITTIVELNRNKSIHLWKGTQAEFNALGEYDVNTLYIVADDTTIFNLETLYETLAGIIEQNTNDTGWLDIMRSDSIVTPVSIGKYRIQGKTAFISIKYLTSTFAIWDSEDEFTLPIALDLHSGNNVIPITLNIDAEDEGTEYIGYYATLSQQNGKTVVSIDAPNIINEVYIPFSYPIVL